MKSTLEAVYKDLEYDVNIRFSTPSETPELDGKGDTAYKGDDGKHTVIINSEYLSDKSKGEILEVISEEASHVINGVEGRIIETGTNEKRLESTGRATNEYFKDKYKDDNTTISLTSEGSIDTSKLGTNVGDKTIVPSKYHKKENFKTDKEKDNVVRAFIETYGGKRTDYYVNWNRYKNNENYREEINYYYLIALNLLQEIEEFKKFPEKYTEVSEKEAIFHNMIDRKIKVIGNLNKKFVNKENGREIVFTHDLKNIVKDTNNLGTFNYYTYEKVYELDSLKHSIDIYN